MAYTLNQGIGSNAGSEHIQRGWLLGLPVLILVLIIAAIISRHHPNRGSGGAQTIPVISALNVSGSSTGKNNSKDGNGNGNSNDALNATASAQPAGGSSSLGFSPVSPIAPATGSSAGTGGVVGGLGGGPTGGGTGGSGGTGGTGVLPDCSIGQIATVNCQVPACSPAVTLSPGQKAILGVAPACIVIN